jgi:hypothetical protein
MKALKSGGVVDVGKYSEIYQYSRIGFINIIILCTLYTYRKPDSGGN